MVAKNRAVTITTNKAIRELTIDIPEEGGVLVFKGTNGAGKTTAICALQGLLGMKVDVSPSDGAEVAEITGLGRRLRMKGRQSSTGRAIVPTLGTRLDLGKLVDPGVADPAARTKMRTRALVALSPNRLKPEDLLDESLSEFIDFDTASEIEDPVELEGFLKRSVDREALDLEKKSAVAAKLAEAKRAEAGDIDQLSGDHDLAALSSAHRSAVQKVGDTEKQISDRAEAIQVNAEAEAKIKSLQDSYQGEQPDVLAAQVAALDADVAELQKQLTAKMGELTKVKRAEAACAEVQEKIQLVRERMRDVSKPVLNEKHLAQFKAKEQAAYQQLLDVELISQRKAALEMAKSQNATAVQQAAQAEELRAAAKSISDKIQKFLPEGPIVIQDGQLCVKHHRRDKLVAYDELSEGERWGIALDYAIKIVGEGGVIPVEQEAWQSLAPSLKLEIVDIALSNRVTVVTAEVSDGDLRVERLTSDELHEVAV